MSYPLGVFRQVAKLRLHPQNLIWFKPAKGNGLKKIIETAITLAVFLCAYANLNKWKIPYFPGTA